MYSDERSHLDLSGVVFLEMSSGSCPDPEIVCVSNVWADSWGDDCEAYAANPGWCGTEESNDNCCVCGGGQLTNSCEPSGTGGGFYAARQVTVVMKAVEFQGCSSAIAGGAVYLNTNSSANISASTIRDCGAMDGGGLHLNGDVTLNLNNVTMERNAAFGSRGGALNAAGALGRNTIEAHGGKFVNNSAKEFGGMACLWPASAFVMDGDAVVQYNSVGDQGAGFYLRQSSSLTVTSISVENNLAGQDGGGMSLHSDSSLVLIQTSVSHNEALDDAGAIILRRSSLIASKCVFDHNKAADSGGSIMSL